MKTKKQRIVGGLAVAIASLAVAAPAAQADDWYRGFETGIVRPDDRADVRGPGAAILESAVRPDDRAVRVSPVGTTFAVVRPDDRAVRISPTSGLETLVRPDDRAVRVSPGTRETAVRPDDRGVRVSPGTIETAVRPDDRGVRVSPVSPVEPVVLPDDRAGERGPGAAPAAPTTILVSPDGFDWTDAGIGAGMALGLILLGSGMLLVARRHRRPTAAVL
jgi:hypothetical protein